MKNIKQIVIFLIVAFVVVGGITLAANYYYDQSSSVSSDGLYNKIKENLPSTSSNNETTAPKSTTTTPKSNPGTTPAATGYTLDQVKAHASASSCWTIVRSTVYDVTSWINQHPGGSGAILQMCGKDATAAFEDQHGGQRRPENELAGFEIGVYKN